MTPEAREAIRQRKVFVVATSQKEAEAVAEMIGHDTRKAAEQHLRDVKAPPTDPFYAAHYRIYQVEWLRRSRAAAEEESTP